MKMSLSSKRFARYRRSFLNATTHSFFTFRSCLRRCFRRITFRTTISVSAKNRSCERLTVEALLDEISVCDEINDAQVLLPKTELTDFNRERFNFDGAASFE